MIEIPFITEAFGYILNLCYKLVPNYAIALLFFALIIKILLFPLGIKQQKNMVKQASLRPKEQAIRNRYAGRTDKVTQQKMQQEIMNLYQEEKFNPMGGCLPMIIQLVIVFSIYAAAVNPLRYVCHIPADNINNISVKIVELYHNGELDIEHAVSESTANNIKKMAEKIGEDGNTTNVKSPFVNKHSIEIVNILKKNGVEKFRGDGMLGESFRDKDLPDFTIFGGSFDLSRTPSIQHFDWLMMIPLLTFLFTFASMKLTKKFTYQPAETVGDAAISMKLMDYTMPLISTVFTFSVPAVVAVYWIYQNIFSTLQQFVLKLMFPYPTFTEEEYKAAEREMNKGIKQPKSIKKSGGRSAHRIDLDDGAPADSGENTAPARGRASGLVPPAALKDESDRKPDDSE